MPRRHGWRKEGVAVPSPVTAAEGALPADDVLARLSTERQACRGTKRRGGCGWWARSRGASPRDESRDSWPTPVRNRAISGCVQPGRPEIRTETANGNDRVTAGGQPLRAEAGGSSRSFLPGITTQY